MKSETTVLTRDKLFREGFAAHEMNYTENSPSGYKMVCVQVNTSKINIVSGATVMDAEGMTNRDMRWARGRKRIPRWYMTWRLSFLKPTLCAANTNDANAKAVPQIAVVIIITFTITPTTITIFVDVVILMILIIADLSTMQPNN